MRDDRWDGVQLKVKGTPRDEWLRYGKFLWCADKKDEDDLTGSKLHQSIKKCKQRRQRHKTTSQAARNNKIGAKNKGKCKVAQKRHIKPKKFSRSQKLHI